MLSRELLPSPEKVASWSQLGHGKSPELLVGGRLNQSVASSAFPKAINSHFSCNIGLLWETAASVIFFKPYNWDLFLNLR